MPVPFVDELGNPLENMDVMSGGGGGAIGAASNALGFNPILAGLSFAGNIGQGMSNRRQEENALNAQKDNQRLGIDQLALQYANYNRQDPSVRARDAVRGDTLANLQDAQLTGSGRDLNYTGGLRPSLLSQGTRNYGQLMSSAATGEGPQDPRLLDNPARVAMLNQLRGNYGPRQQRFTEPTAQKKAGLAEKILSIF